MQESGWGYTVLQALKWMCKEEIGQDSSPFTSGDFRVGVLSNPAVCLCYSQWEGVGGTSKEWIIP